MSLAYTSNPLILQLKLTKMASGVLIEERSYTLGVSRDATPWRISQTVPVEAQIFVDLLGTPPSLAHKGTDRLFVGAQEGWLSIPQITLRLNNETRGIIELKMHTRIGNEA